MHNADAQIVELRIVSSNLCGRLARSRWRESSSYLEAQTRAGKKDNQRVQRSREHYHGEHDRPTERTVVCTRCRRASVFS